MSLNRRLRVVAATSSHSPPPRLLRKNWKKVTGNLRRCALPAPAASRAPCAGQGVRHPLQIGAIVCIAGWRLEVRAFPA